MTFGAKGVHHPICDQLQFRAGLIRRNLPMILVLRVRPGSFLIGGNDEGIW